jgi:hypothetical protein
MEHCKNALLWNKIIDDEATTEKTLDNVDDDIVTSGLGAGRP